MSSRTYARSHRKLGSEDPSLEESLSGHSRPVTTVEFHSTTRQLLAGSLDGTVVVHAIDQQARPIRYLGHKKEPVFCIKYSPAHDLAASTSRDRTVRLWQPTVLGTRDGRSQVLRGHLAPVRSVDFTPDGRLMLTASDDKTAKVWAVAQQQCCGTLTGHSNWLRCGRLSADGSLAMTGSDDKSIKLWDTSFKRCTATFEGSKGGVNALTLLPGDRTAISGCSHGQISVWDLRSGAATAELLDHEAAITGLAVHPREASLVSASLDGSLKLWDLRQGRLQYTLRAHEGPVLCAAFSPAGDRIASGGADHRVLLWRSGGARPSPEQQDRPGRPASGLSKATQRASGEVRKDTIPRRPKTALIAKAAPSVLDDAHSMRPVTAWSPVAWKGWPVTEMSSSDFKPRKEDPGSDGTLGASIPTVRAPIMTWGGFGDSQPVAEADSRDLTAIKAVKCSNNMGETKSESIPVAEQLLCLAEQVSALCQRVSQLEAAQSPAKEPA